MIRLLSLLAALFLAAGATAHEVRPAMLQLIESRPGDYVATWKQPTVGDMAVHLAPRLSSGALDGAPASQSAAPGFLVREWRVKGGAPLDGQTLAIEGLPQAVTDVVVHIQSAEGLTREALLRPAEPSIKLVLHKPRGVVLPAYLKLGIEHILTGIDHLLFVLGLLMLVGMNRRILAVVTAFTVAHSITLALAALGYIHFNPALIEVMVALSIVFVAVELVPRPDAPVSLTRRFPWIIAFTFGLLHGMAFAGALAEIGLPPGQAPMALFLFNVGVELGQLAFITFAIGVILLLRRVRARLPVLPARVNPDRLARLAPAYTIGALACWWTFERIAAAF